MLLNLHVKNLALIDEAEVEFKNGLNILTGETGAGKSIILGSVNLALGGRYNADILRHGAEYGFVELTFLVENREQAEKLKQLDIFPEEGQVVLSRRMMANRSVSRINGETVSLSALKDAASVLIDIYGQHEHQTLLHKKNHLAILDDYAGEDAAKAREQVDLAYQEYKQCLEELKTASLNEEEQKKEMALLEYEINEITEASLTAGEEESLENQYRLMINGKKIVEAVQEAYQHTGEPGTENASEAISRAVRCLQEASECDGQIKVLYDQLIEVDSLLNDFNRELSNYGKGFEFSSEDFYEVENRLNEVNRLRAKYGGTAQDILTYCQEKEERLLVLRDYDQYKEKLQKNCDRAEQKLKKTSDDLSRIRKRNAADFKKSVSGGLKELNFLDVVFDVRFTSLDRYTASGTDDVEFMISLNPGMPVRPLAEVASGGELSRIMLAIKAVMAEKDDIETLIFDEIDVGISGRTAQKVSEKMAVIGKCHQVLCITHLAQIAAMADAHYVIEKEVCDGITRTAIRLLDEKSSELELARILGGAEITEKVMQSAVEMKELAKRAK